MIFSKTTSRLISFLMVVVMLVGMFPMQAFAADTVTYEKANSIESGKTYVIVADSRAMTSVENGGYVNDYNYSYSGFNGESVTVSGSNITAGVTEDMYWKLTASGSGYTVQHVASGKYLKSSYESNSNGGSDGKLFLTETAEDTWTWSSQKFTSSASKKQLTFDDNITNIKTGNDDFFGIRSTGDNISFYEVKSTSGGDEGGNQGGQTPSAQVIEITTNKEAASATKNVSIEVGESFTLKLTNASGAEKTHAISNTDSSVASVDASNNFSIAGNGTKEITITGLKNGKTTITFTGTSSGGSTYYAVVNVTVGTGASEGGNQGGGSQSSETVSITSKKEGDGGASASATIAVGQELVINLTNGSSSNPKNYTVKVENGNVAEVTSAASFSLEKSATTQVKVKGLANGTTKVVMTGGTTSGSSQESVYVATINLTVGTGVSEGGNEGGGNQGGTTETKTASIETSKGSADADATASVEIAVGQKVIVTVNNGSGNERTYQISAASGSDKVTLSATSLTTAKNASGTFEVTGKAAGTAKIELESQAVNSSVYYGIVNVTVTGEGGTTPDPDPTPDPDAPSDGKVVVIAGSDYQASDSSSIMTNIMNQIKKDYPSVYGILMGGDYSSGNTTSSDIQGMNNAVSGVFPGIASENRIYIQGNHDNWGGQTPSNSLIAATGAHDTQYYGVYSINDSDFDSAQSGLENYLNGKVQSGYDKPIFVVTHRPLHKNSRNDNNNAVNLFKAMNEAGGKGLTIIYLFGHNHSSAQYDDYLGGGSIYLKKGDSMMVAGGSTETLNFTYLNCGYVGYCRNAESTLTMTAFEITEDEVIVKRYSASGVYKLKAAGTSSSSSYPANTTVYQSPQTIALDGTVTPPVDPPVNPNPETTEVAITTTKNEIGDTAKASATIKVGDTLKVTVTNGSGNTRQHTLSVDKSGIVEVPANFETTARETKSFNVKGLAAGTAVITLTSNNNTSGSGTSIYMGEITVTVVGEGGNTPDVPEIPDGDYTKVDTVTNGDYVIVVGEDRGLTNQTGATVSGGSNSNSYAGLKSNKVTISGKTITAGVTDGMIWTVTVNNGKITIQNENGKYLAADYGSSNTGNTRKLLLADAADANWVYTDGKLNNTAQNTSQTDDRYTGCYLYQTTNTTDYTISVRSKSNASNVAFYKVNVEGGEEHEHKYGAPTYTGDGKTAYGATRECTCGDKQTATATITSAVTTEATCTAEGVRTYTANFAEEWAEDKTTTEAIAKLDHNYGTLIAEVPATHTATELRAGMKAHYKCSGCQKFFTADKVETTETALTIATPTHTYGTAWESDTNNHWHECSCGAKSNVAGHTPGAAATETTAQKCTVCQFVIAPATGHVTHSYTVPVSETAATCTQTGTKVMKCSGCDETETTTLAIDPSNHTYGTLIAKVDAVHTATELKAGKEAHYKCACGKFFTEAKVETTEAALVIAAPTHSYGNEWKSNDEQHWHECSCGAKNAVADHSFANGDCVCGKKAPEAPVVPSNPTKVDTLVDGQYVIVGARNMALNLVDATWTGDSGGNTYKYDGFAGTSVTISGNTITSDVSNDMIWEILKVNGGYTVRNVQENKYLKGSYTNSGRTGILELVDTAFTWTYADNMFKFHDSANNKDRAISNDDSEYQNRFNHFTVRSNGTALSFYKVVSQDTPVAKTLSSIAVTTQPTKTTYTAGENFSTAGMVVTATYSDNSTKVITDFTVTDGSNLAAGKTSVTVSYTEGGVTKTATVSITVNQATQPEQPEQPAGNPTKVTTLVEGQYIIANGSNALTSKVHSGYTNSNSYKYSGFEGAAVTITGNEITAGATDDMVFEIKTSGNGYTIQHVDSGKYLTASYTQNSNNSGWTGTLTLGTTAEVWEWNSSNGYLKSTNASNNEKGLYLVFDDRSNNVSNGSQQNLFGIRSDGSSGQNLDKIDFYKIGKEIADEEVKVTGVSLDKTTAELNVGGSITLAATVAPANADNKAVTWTSSDTSVAIVDANGKVTAVKAGNATITATTADGGFTAACAITVKAVETPDDDSNAVYVAFTSDVHSKTTDKTDSGHSPYRLNNWLTGVSGVIGADLEDMVFCGDNADGTGAANGNDYWAKVGAAMDVAAENTHLKTEGLFLAGNHEWENGSLGNTSSLSAEAQARAAKIQPVGKVVTTDNYVLYLFGASSSSQSGNGFKTEDLTALNNYLISAPADRPIFITSHFPIHNFGSRSTKNADQMIDTLNKYGDKLDLYFIWGHNHSQSDSNYDKFFDEDDTLLNKNIKFTYCAAGAMSDSEYQGSASVKGKGLVAKIVDGKIESLTYYGTSNDVVATYKPDYSADPEEPGTPDAPVVPDEPGKVETLEDGFYVIANGNHALTTEVHNGYTNSNNYSYSGFKGADVTIADNKITSGATEAMVFEVKASGTGYTIKHVDSGKYLTASYTQNSNNSGWTGTLTLGTTAEVWEWNSSNGYLKSTNASNSEKGLYLVFDEVSNDVTTGTQENLFGIRSDSNEGKNMDRIDFYAVVIDDEEHVHKYNTVVTDPTCTEAGYTTFTCSCGESFTSNTTAALGHDWDDGAVTVPTCTGAGYTTYTCEVCEETYTDNEVAALGHNEVTDPAVEATCTTNGLTEGKHCSVCEVTIIAQTPVAALGHKWDDGVVTKQPTAAEPGIKTLTCTVCDETQTEEIPFEGQMSDVLRISGKDRVKTALSVARALKDTLGVDKFDSVIIATGVNEKFADALSGSYLANMKKAPILLYTNSGLSQLNVNFIKENLKANGTVYILGGDSAVPVSVEETLAAYNVVRLSGKTRYETNLAILKEAGISGADEILVATGTNFADSLSASAVGLPLMLVNGNGTGLNGAQIEFLKSAEGKKITIIGGDSAVSEEMKVAIEAITGVTAERISGKTRHNTSVMIAQKYFPGADFALITYAKNFPDGLAGGPLAYAMGAPLLLTNAGQEGIANEYITAGSIERGYVLGGDSAVSDETARKVFGLAADAAIEKAYYTE